MGTAFASVLFMWALGSAVQFFSTATRDLSVENNRIRTEAFYELQYCKCMRKTEWELGEAI